MSAQTPASQQLRARASTLRSKAQQLDHALLHSVACRAGRETWVGPSADYFMSDLRMATSDLDTLVDSLTVAARRLDRRAENLEAVAAATPIPSAGPR